MSAHAAVRRDLRWIDARRRAIFDALEQGLAAALLIALPYVVAAQGQGKVGAFPFREVLGLSGGAFVLSGLLAFTTWINKARYVGFAVNAAVQVAIAMVSTAVTQLTLSNSHVNLFTIPYSHLFTVVGFAGVVTLFKCLVAHSVTGGASLVPRVALGRPRKVIGGIVTSRAPVVEAAR